MPMSYPPDFVAAVKAVYPSWGALHKALDEGSQIAGYYLADACENGVSNERILTATSLEEVQAIARRNKAVAKLYDRYLDLQLGGKK